jgi:hypothetical protein
VNGDEHRDIGDSAFGHGMVNLGGESSEEEFWLGYGDVMALSGDYFRPQDLFALARIAGERGTRVGTRDEIVCALKVMAVDEVAVDSRFEPGGRFSDFEFSARAASTDVERHVRDRYLQLAATNDDHFVTPGGVTHESVSRPLGSAPLAYRHFHHVALEEAWRQGRAHGDLSVAMAREAAAQHFLTDAFTAGHLRTPVAQIRRFWLSRYPDFWQNLQRLVSTSTAAGLRDLSPALRALPASFLQDSTHAALQRRVSRYPQLSLGDFLARLFHDWDNVHGLEVDGGAVIFGDGHVHEGATRQLALAAVRAGIADVEAAYDLGATGHVLTGEPLYGAVRSATGASETSFRAELLIPRPSAANPAQNWQASDLESLWSTPIVGAGETTVGQALTEMLQPDGQFIRQLDCLGQGLVEPYGLLATPVLGAWLSKKGCQAYHRGFVEPLAAQPKRAVLGVCQSRERMEASPPRLSRRPWIRRTAAVADRTRRRTPHPPARASR